MTHLGDMSDINKSLNTAIISQLISEIREPVLKIEKKERKKDIGSARRCLCASDRHACFLALLRSNVLGKAIVRAYAGK